MEDRYLFKAKRLDWRKFPEKEWWITGYYVLGFDKAHKQPVHLIFEPITMYSFHADTETWTEIEKNTLCQCTGLKDVNGNLIWENDIVDSLGHKGTIKFECGGFGIGYRKNIDWKELQSNIMRVTGCENILYACENDNYISLWEIYWNFIDEDDSLNTVEVIGNIFDNPELLESEG